MIKVNVKKQSNYPIDTVKLKRHIKNFLARKGIVSDSELSIALVGKKKMLDLSKQYMKDNKAHKVLSFVADEVQDNFVYPPNGKIHLGEIVVCYPEAFDEAKSQGVRIDDKVVELVEHGALHLMGEHHE